MAFHDASSASIPLGRGRLEPVDPMTLSYHFPTC
jgi:hypothetical protein